MIVSIPILSAASARLERLLRTRQRNGHQNRQEARNGSESRASMELLIESRKTNRAIRASADLPMEHFACSPSHKQQFPRGSFFRAPNGKALDLGEPGAAGQGPRQWHPIRHTDRDGRLRGGRPESTQLMESQQQARGPAGTMSGYLARGVGDGLARTNQGRPGGMSRSGVRQRDAHS